ncbi:aspartate ammonia-lyase [Clostridium saccharobutylicum]|nr:aspartate ammonia-lyase [Clostridium saccharobutylicum]
MMTDLIQDLTGLGIARSDYPMDITQNCDIFVETSGLLKSCSVNLLKISNDLRLLNSGPRGGIGEVILPKMQTGSTIMPGKVNPVIPEMVAQVSLRVISNDSAINYGKLNGTIRIKCIHPTYS